MTLTLEENDVKATISHDNPDFDDLFKAFVAACVGIGYSEDFIYQAIQDIVGV